MLKIYLLHFHHYSILYPQFICKKCSIFKLSCQFLIFFFLFQIIIFKYIDDKDIFQKVYLLAHIHVVFVMLTFVEIHVHVWCTYTAKPVLNGHPLLSGQFKSPENFSS